MTALCLFSLLISTALIACDPGGDSTAAVRHVNYERVVADSGLGSTSLGRRWREAGERALHEPTPVELPYVEQGAFLSHEAEAVGFAFDATAGQRLEIEFVRHPIGDGSEDRGKIYVDVFRVTQDGSGAAFERLEDTAIDGMTVAVSMPATARYVVRIQPELLVSTMYGLMLELAATLPFPVAGLDAGAVQSFFGDNRDAGSRQHLGVDIFAERLTPVLAVANGRAVPSHDNLGGNVVWLNTAGVSYYYAHLERFGIPGPERVVPGDVLGYVGNTGNAATTPPHLHFALYRWGRGAIDPLPLLTERRWPLDREPGALFEPRFVRVNAAALNVRASPSLRGDVLAKLPGGTIVWAPARSEAWLRVRDSRARGWISSDFQEPLLARGIAAETAAGLTLLRAAPAPDAQVVAAISAGARIYPLAVLDDSRLVSLGEGATAGWINN